MPYGILSRVCSSCSKKKKKLLKVKSPCPLIKDMLLCLDDMISSDNEINGSRDWIELVNHGAWLKCFSTA